MKKNPEYYIQKGHPVEWFQMSSELFYSAKILYLARNEALTSSPHYNGLKPVVSNGYFILAGYALENCLKGLAISENPELIKPEGQIDKRISIGHNLSKLLDFISSISFENNEIEILNMYSEALPYWGRYPLPKKINNLSTEQFLNDEVFSLTKSIYEKTRRKIYDLTGNGWIDSKGNKIKGWETNDFN